MDDENGGFVTFPFSSNELSISIGTVYTLAKIDSGADINVITKSFLDSLPIHFKNKFPRKSSQIYCANGSTASVLGEVALPIDIAKTKMSVKFTVMDVGQNDIYLGIPFLEQYSAVLNFSSSKENTISLHLGAPVFSENFIELEPYTETILSGTIQAFVPNPSQGYCFPSNGTFGKGFIAAHAAVTAHEGRIPVRIFNS